MLTKIPDGSVEVIELLQKEDMLTLDEISHKLSNIEVGTLRYAIRRLLEVNILQSIPDLLDMRTVKYRMNSDAGLREVLMDLPGPILDQLKNSLDKSVGEQSV